MSYEQLCMGCMQGKHSETATCTFCGYLESSAPKSPLYLTPRTCLGGKYLIGRVLGQGGFGITYLAWDMNLGIKIAVKEYFPQDLASRATGQPHVTAFSGPKSRQYETFMENFLLEARTLAQFEYHPNIVSVRDFFEGNGTAYFVMNFIEGLTLKEYLADTGGRIPVSKAEAIMMPVLDALKEIHATNFLHRDISPDNIFIDTKGRIILVDFGAARQAVANKERSMSIILKPGYAPEEQYRSRGKQGPWTDIYAAAATFYHLITGRQPPEALERLVDDKLVLPSQIGAELNHRQEAALIKAMAVRASDRFQTVQEFQDALSGQAVDHLPPALSTDEKTWLAPPDEQERLVVHIPAPKERAPEAARRPYIDRQSTQPPLTKPPVAKPPVAKPPEYQHHPAKTNQQKSFPLLSYIIPAAIAIIGILAGVFWVGGSFYGQDSADAEVPPLRQEEQLAEQPAEQPAEEIFFVITPAGSNLFIRKSPGTKNKASDDIITRIPRGTEVEVHNTHGNSIVVDSFTWWEVRVPATNTRGWVASEYLSTNDSDVYN